MSEIVEKIGKCPKCDAQGYYIEQEPIIDICMICHGEGTLKVEPGMKVCGLCQGKGINIITQRSPIGFHKYKQVCNRCRGTCIIKEDE